MIMFKHQQKVTFKMLNTCSNMKKIKCVSSIKLNQLYTYSCCRSLFKKLED